MTELEHIIVGYTILFVLFKTIFKPITQRSQDVERWQKFFCEMFFS